MFTLVLSTGQMAGALAAIGVLLLGVYKYIIRPAQKVVKVYNSVGSNGKGPTAGETVFQLLHGIKDDVGTLKANISTIADWRTTVDDTLQYQDMTLISQSRQLDALAVSMDALLERDDKR